METKSNGVYKKQPLQFHHFYDFIYENIKQNLNLDQNSNVLVIGCEGDTDQEMYQKLINQN